MEWYRNDKAAVAEALRRGERPDLATTMASGPLDELVASTRNWASLRSWMSWRCSEHEQAWALRIAQWERCDRA